MTSNMIAYRNYQETVKHNREMERLTGEQQAEVRRHDLATETEQQRSNMANEQIKANTNAINAQHYGRQDFETARHDAVSEYYSLQLPSPYSISKTSSETALNYARAGESTNSSDLKAAQAKLTRKQYDTESAKVQNINADTKLKEAQTSKTNVETKLAPWNAYTTRFRDASTGLKSLSETGFNILKMINPVRYGLFKERK